MPSGQTARPNIADNKDGTVTVKYSPTERGLHEMDIKYDGNHIPGNCSVCYKHNIICKHGEFRENLTLLMLPCWMIHGPNDPWSLDHLRSVQMSADWSPPCVCRSSKGKQKSLDINLSRDI